MTQILSNKDINFLLGNGPTLVSSTPMIKTQGNGNFTGFVKQIWSDGSESNAEFIMNARSRDDVMSAYISSRSVAV